MKIEFCPFCNKKLDYPGRSYNSKTSVLLHCSYCGSFYLPGIIFDFQQKEQYKWLNYSYYLFLKEKVKRGIISFYLSGYKKPTNKEIIISISLDNFYGEYPNTDEQKDTMILENLRNLASTDIENRIFDDEISPRLLFAEDKLDFFNKKQQHIINPLNEGKILMKRDKYTSYKFISK